MLLNYGRVKMNRKWSYSFTTALNEILVIKNIKEFYVNDICVDMDVNTI